jgi:DNA-binding MarR family transcriptional regulator
MIRFEMDDDGDGHALARRLMELAPMMMQSMVRELRTVDHHIEPNHMQILGLLARRQFTMSELADKQRVSLPAVSKTISALVDRGWVERMAVPDDRRVVQLKLTAEGLGLLKEMRRTMIASVERILDRLTAEERAQLSTGLDVLYRAIGNPLPQCAAQDVVVPGNDAQAPVLAPYGAVAE